MALRKPKRKGKNTHIHAARLKGLPKREFFLAARKGNSALKLCYVGRVRNEKGRPMGPWIIARVSGLMKGGILCFKPTSLRKDKKKKIEKWDKRFLFFALKWMLWSEGELTRPFG